MGKDDVDKNDVERRKTIEGTASEKISNYIRFDHQIRGKDERRQGAKARKDTKGIKEDKSRGKTRFSSDEEGRKHKISLKFDIKRY